MKKLLILASALVVAASVAQATNVKWGINSGALDTEKFADGSTIYLMQGLALHMMATSQKRPRSPLTRLLEVPLSTTVAKLPEL